MDIHMGFCCLSVRNRNLKYKFNQSFVRGLNKTAYEKKLRKSDMSCKKMWTTSYKNKWNKSTLNSMLVKPNKAKM